MAERISPGEAVRRAGTTLEDVVNEDEQIPACCSEGCLTDCDGECPHGYPSVLLELGLI